MATGRTSGTWVGPSEASGREIGRWRVYTTHYTEGNSAREWSCPAQRPASPALNDAQHLSQRAAWCPDGSSSLGLQFSSPQPRKKKKRTPEPKVSSHMRG